jgi:hypothetical protein
MTEIRVEDGRWIRQDGVSEVGQRVMAAGLDAEDEPGQHCLICDEPATTKTVLNTWNPDTAEEKIGLLYVCDVHRGQWYWIADEMQFAWDGATQRSMNR